MSRLRFTKDESVALTYYIINLEAYAQGIRQILDSAARTKDTTSIHQPLAPRKPTKRRPKGHAAKGGIKARKGAGKK